MVTEDEEVLGEEAGAPAEMPGPEKLAEEVAIGGSEAIEAAIPLSERGKKERNRAFGALYTAVTLLLIAASVTLVTLNFAGVIDLAEPPLLYVDIALLSVFWLDFIVRFILSKEKKVFFLHNLIEIVSILPLSYLWHPLHALHYLHLYRVFHMFHRAQRLGADEVLPQEDEGGISDLS